ncbi:hypothetical protein HY483_01625 [Candidatus Woesearchaeota archaeon]|nr:hypothetical protein [Candidatus Woesearchaeota archaeon]
MDEFESDRYVTPMYVRVISKIPLVSRVVERIADALVDFSPKYRIEVAMNLFSRDSSNICRNMENIAERIDAIALRINPSDIVKSEDISGIVTPEEAKALDAGLAGVDGHNGVPSDPPESNYYTFEVLG